MLSADLSQSAQAPEDGSISAPIVTVESSNQFTTCMKTRVKEPWVSLGLMTTCYVVPWLVTQSCLTLWDSMDCSLPGFSVHGDSLGKNTGMGCQSLPQRIFSTQALNPDLPLCRWILYQLSYQGSLMTTYKTTTAINISKFTMYMALENQCYSTEQGWCSQTARVWIMTLPLIRCVTLDKLRNLFASVSTFTNRNSIQNCC